MKAGYAILLALLTFIAGGVVATLALLIISGGSGKSTSPLAFRSNPQGPEMVVVAKKKMLQWSSIRQPRDAFETRQILPAESPANAIPAWRLDELSGRRLRATVDPGAILTEDHLLKREITGVDMLLEPGHRAMAVPITGDKAVGFFVMPGSKVDVIHTYNGISSIVLEDVLVLAVDQVTARPDDKVGVIGATATLYLYEPEQGLKLASALDRGTIRLMLRAPGDSSKYTAPGPIPPAPVVPPPPAPPPSPFKDD